MDDYEDEYEVDVAGAFVLAAHAADGAKEQELKRLSTPVWLLDLHLVDLELKLAWFLYVDKAKTAQIAAIGLEG